MNTTTSDVSAKTRRLLVFQACAGFAVALGFYFFKGMIGFQSAVFGALISMASALWLSRGVKQAESNAVQDPKRSMATLYLGAVQRFVLVIALFIVGLGVLKLDPIAMGAGFLLAQLGFVIQFKSLSKVG